MVSRAFHSGLKELDLYLYEEDGKTILWKYAGGSRNEDHDNKAQHHYNYYQMAYADKYPMPDHKDACICNVAIKQNCFIVHNKLGRILVVGNCCIKHFLPEDRSGRTCEICEEPHKNRKDNYCFQCRDAGYKKCASCRQTCCSDNEFCKPCYAKLLQEIKEENEEKRKKEEEKRKEEEEREKRRKIEFQETEKRQLEKRKEHEKRQKELELLENQEIERKNLKIAIKRFSQTFENQTSETPTLKICANCPREIQSHFTLCFLCNKNKNKNKNQTLPNIKYGIVKFCENCRKEIQPNFTLCFLCNMNK